MLRNVVYVQYSTGRSSSGGGSTSEGIGVDVATTRVETGVGIGADDSGVRVGLVVGDIGTGVGLVEGDVGMDASTTGSRTARPLLQADETIPTTNSPTIRKESFL